jgi:hypothetical protein
MVRQYARRNKFGGLIWEIEFINVFPIRIQETNDNSYIVDFLERDFYFFNRTIFSFVSNKSLEEVVIEATDKAYIYLLGRKGINWSLYQKEKFQRDTIDDLKNLRQSD